MWHGVKTSCVYRCTFRFIGNNLNVQRDVQVSTDERSLPLARVQRPPPSAPTARSAQQLLPHPRRPTPARSGGW